MIWAQIVGCLCVVWLVRTTEAAGCPCSDESLCEQVSTNTPNEVFVFSTTNKNWRNYDWNKVTTVASSYIDRELMCYAHSKKARVVAMVNFPVENLTDVTQRSIWILDKVAYCRENFLDGVNVDFEAVISADQPKVRDGLTSLMKELTNVFKLEFKNSQVTFDFAWSAECIDLRCYDHASIAELADFVFIMDYDTRSQIFGECIAWANSPLNSTVHGIETFLKLGIPAEKLVLGVPWYGYNYPCVSYTQHDDKCVIKEVPFRGVNCSDAAGSQSNYPSVINRFLPNSTTGGVPQWDNVSASPYFSYKNPDTAQMHQIWYDNPMSLGYKYNLAAVLGLRGVGMWNADALDYSDSPTARLQTAQMWAILPSRH